MGIFFVVFLRRIAYLAYIADTQKNNKKYTHSPFAAYDMICKSILMRNPRGMYERRRATKY